MLKRILPAWRMTHLAMLVAAAPLLLSDWFFFIEELQKEPDVQKYPFEGKQKDVWMQRMSVGIWIALLITCDNNSWQMPKSQLPFHVPQVEP